MFCASVVCCDDVRTPWICVKTSDAESPSLWAFCRIDSTCDCCDDVRLKLSKMFVADDVDELDVVDDGDCALAPGRFCRSEAKVLC